MQLSRSKDLLCMRKHGGTRGFVVGTSPPPSLISAQQKVGIKTILSASGTPFLKKKKKIPFFCVLLYKGKDQLSPSKS